MDRRALAVASRLARRRTRYCPHEAFPTQARFLSLDCLEALFGGAAGGGKSDALLMAALQYVHVPGYAALLLRRTYTDLALPDAIMDRSHQWLASTDARWDDRDKTWHFKTSGEDATLTFGYLETEQDKYRYQSAQFQFVGFDELTQHVEAAYTYLFSRLRRLKTSTVPLRMRGATNPGGIGHRWVKARFVEQATASGEFVPSKLEDNPHIDQGSYREALAKLDPTTRAQLEHGLWVQDTSGLVYAQFERVKHLLPAPRDKCDRHVLAIDFGVVDATAFVVLGWNRHERIVWVLHVEQHTGMIPSEAAARAKELGETWPLDRIVGDEGGLGKAFAEEMRKRWAIPIVPAQKRDKLGFIKLLNGALASSTVFLAAGQTEDLAGELETLPWSNGDHDEEAASFPNHRTDAFLYGWRDCWAFNEKDEHREPAHGSPEWYAIQLAKEKAEASKAAARQLKRAPRRFG